MQRDTARSEDRYIEIDVGIKTVLAVLLSVAGCWCGSRLELLYYSLCLVVITILLRVDLRFILKNLAAYGIFIVFPYLCGLLLSLLINQLFPGSAYIYHFEATLFRMAKIFFIWYIGSLYFFTTPIKTIMALFYKIFFPLRYLGVPVAKHLNMVAVVVKKLTGSVSQFKQDVLEQARHIFKNDQMGFAAKLKALSNLLAVFIADSLQQTDEIQAEVDQNALKENQYKPRISLNEILAVVIAGIIVFLLLKY